MSVSLSRDNLNRPANSHWRQLAVLLRRDPGSAAHLLRRPPSAIPDPGTVRHVQARGEGTGLEELLARHLLAGILLDRRPRQAAWPAEIREPLLRHLDGIDPAAALGWHWIGVPVVAVLAGRARSVWMLIARQPAGSGCRCLCAPVPDTGTRDCIRQALEQVDPDHGFSYWFLQEAEEPPVRGPSLGLAVGLAALLLREEKNWPRGLYATGTLEPGAIVGPVGHIREKRRAAGADCRLFLIPAANSLGSGAGREFLACRSFADARFAVGLFAGGVAADSIALCQAASSDPGELLAAFPRLPLSFLRSETCAGLLRQATDDLSRFLPALARCLRQCDQDTPRAAILADLLPADELRRLCQDRNDQPPEPVFAAFRWCLARIALASHQGDVTTSETWAQVAGELRPRVEADDVGHLVTRNMVAGRFNRYDFRPDPPAEFRHALRIERRRWEIDRRSNPLLGAMYGTLAQNFGFCGPAFLDQLQDATDNAEKAFGRKHRQEGRRMVNYRIYGLLDAGRQEEAARLLPPYLGADRGSGPAEWFVTACRLLQEQDSDAVFRASLALRLLADTGFAGGDAREWQVVVAIVSAAQAHPWQLVALNLGRIAAAAGLSGLAARLFRHAADICGRGGETMRPMALLPLAELQAAGDAGGRSREIGKIRDWLWQTTSLNRAHFQAILGLDGPDDIARVVLRERRLLFPFSYR